MDLKQEGTAKMVREIKVKDGDPSEMTVDTRGRHASF